MNPTRRPNDNEIPRPEDLSRIARQAFERKFGVEPGVWLDRYEADGPSIVIYYGYVSDMTGTGIGQFFAQIPTNLKN